MPWIAVVQSLLWALWLLSPRFGALVPLWLASLPALFAGAWLLLGIALVLLMTAVPGKPHRASDRR